jgi:hypothetical protein
LELQKFYVWFRPGSVICIGSSGNSVWFISVQIVVSCVILYGYSSFSVHNECEYKDELYVHVNIHHCYSSFSVPSELITCEYTSELITKLETDYSSFSVPDQT